MTCYAAIDPQGYVTTQEGVPDFPGMVGPPAPPSWSLEDHQYVQVARVIRGVEAPTATSALMLVDDTLQWVEHATLEQQIAAVVRDIDTLADKVRDQVVVSANRTLEYTRAMTHAAEFKASNWTLDPVPSGVASWQRAMYRENWTAQQAAEDILLTAALWNGALDRIRDLRLKLKQDAKASTFSGQPYMHLHIFEQSMQVLSAALQGR